MVFQVKILEVSFQAKGHLYFRMKCTSSFQAVSTQILVFKVQNVSDVQSFLNRCRTINFSSTGHTQKNGAVSKVNKKFIFHLTRAQRTPPAAATVQVSHALPAVRFSCLLRGRVASFQDGVAAGKGFLCALF